MWQGLSDALPLIDRKLRLRSVVPQRSLRLLYCDHVERDGEGLFRLACEHDLEGIVAKWKSGPYLPEKPTSWIKIRNRNYSQWLGREELFEAKLFQCKKPTISGGLSIRFGTILTLNVRL